MRIRLPSKVVAAALAPALLVATAAQGLAFMRCGSAVQVAASCCCHKDEAPAPASDVMASDGSCCDHLTVPTTQPQVEPRSKAPVPSPAIVAVIQEPLPLAGALRDGVPGPRLDPPPAPSPLLASCSLLI